MPPDAASQDSVAPTDFFKGWWVPGPNWPCWRGQGSAMLKPLLTAVGAGVGAAVGTSRRC